MTSAMKDALEAPKIPLSQRISVQPPKRESLISMNPFQSIVSQVNKSHFLNHIKFS